MPTVHPSGVIMLRLYVSGNAPNSVTAIVNARAICDAHFALRNELEIIDLAEHPGQALADGIIVTPTLLKWSPAPVQRVIGNLSDTQAVVSALGGT